MVIYKKMSLFDAPEGSFLVHAANAQGNWGSGIAAQIKELYPSQYEHYQQWAHSLGYSVFKSTTKDKHCIVNLITSDGESNNPDPQADILINTTLAINDFLNVLDESDNPYLRFIRTPYIIYSNKFNSGLFNVPWEQTERILNILTKRYNVTWVVCDPNMKE